LQRSLKFNREGLGFARAHGEIESEANALTNLGVDHLWLGDLDQAEQCFVDAWALLEKQFGGYRWRWKTRLLTAWGELCLARGEPVRALDYAERCLELAERTSARKNLVKGWKLKGEALATLDRLEEAVVWLKKGSRMAEEKGKLAQLNGFLDRALAGQGQVCFVTGEAGVGKTCPELRRRAALYTAGAWLLCESGLCQNREAQLHA